ncbi:MAG: NTP transferase domain-containing protein [Armatimonadetes bacterium]|nr:NTP transferase domain-containing protein [Armatimonadota bacterium]
MKAVVMAGGEGSRLRPLTCNRPKPLVPIVNKPIMQHIIELLVRCGFTDVIATLHYLADEIETYFGDGSEFGVRMRYTVEETPLGTAGSVKQAEPWLSDGTFIIISGDALTDFDLRKAVEFHKRQGAMATIVLTRVESPLEYGVVITDQDSRIRRFLEKPDWSQVFSDTINTGIYILEPEVLSYMELGKNYDWSQDIFPQLLKERKPLLGYLASGYWCDVGSLQAYRQAHYDALRGKVRLNIPGERGEDEIWVHPTARIEPGVRINGPAVIGSHATIRRGAVIEEFTVLGDSCIVEREAEVHGSILWNGAYVGDRVRIDGAVVGRNCSIDRGSELLEGAVIGDRTHIQRSSLVFPHIKIWPDKTVEAGARVTESLVWGPRWSRTLFSEGGVSGLANIEMTPDFATKLATAYGSYLGRGATVIISRDAHPTSRMIKRALASGLMSAGINVQDLRSIPVSVSRFLLAESGARGGVHVRISPHDPRMITVELCNAKGAILDKNAQRKVENIFFREDFVRADFVGVGTLEYVPWTVERYTERLTELVDCKACHDSRFRVMLDCAYGGASAVLPSALGALGCDLVTLNGFSRPLEEPRTAEEKERSVLELSNLVKSVEADIGLLVHNDGETMHVTDHTGRPIADSMLLSIMCMLAFATGDARVVAVPASAPSVIEQIAEGFRGRVIRTKSDPAALMGLALADRDGVDLIGDTEGRFIFPRFHPAFDAMISCAKLIEYLARSGKRRLADVVALVPRYHLRRADVSCPWEKKGEIMRRLTEEAEQGRADFTEGVKVITDRGWVLVSPDAFEPTFHIYAEAGSPEHATELIVRFREKIETLCS